MLQRTAPRSSEPALLPVRVEYSHRGIKIRPAPLTVAVQPLGLAVKIVVESAASLVHAALFAYGIIGEFFRLGLGHLTFDFVVQSAHFKSVGTHTAYLFPAVGIGFVPPGPL